MCNILITGANGQLGSELQVLAENYPDWSFHFTDRNELDITRKEEIEVFFKETPLDFCINCAAYTAVDKAEILVIFVDDKNAMHRARYRY